MVERPRCGHADAQERQPGRISDPRDRPYDRLHRRLRAGPEVQRATALGDDAARQVHPYRPELVAVQVHSDGVTCVRHQPEQGARLAAGGRRSAGLHDQAVGAEPGRDLADGLRGEPRTGREFGAAQARRAGATQQVQQQRLVVPAQRRQVHPATTLPATPVHSPIVHPPCTLTTLSPKWSP